MRVRSDPSSSPSGGGTAATGRSEGAMPGRVRGRAAEDAGGVEIGAPATRGKGGGTPTERLGPPPKEGRAGASPKPRRAARAARSTSGAAVEKPPPPDIVTSEVGTSFKKRDISASSKPVPGTSRRRLRRPDGPPA